MTRTTASPTTSPRIDWRHSGTNDKSPSLKGFFYAKKEAGSISGRLTQLHLEHPVQKFFERSETFRGLCAVHHLFDALSVERQFGDTGRQVRNRRMVIHVFQLGVANSFDLFDDLCHLILRKRLLPDSHGGDKSFALIKDFGRAQIESGGVDRALTKASRSADGQFHLILVGRSEFPIDRWTACPKEEQA